jgi:hypothetical protein
MAEAIKEIEQDEPLSPRDDVANDVAAAIASLKGEQDPPDVETAQGTGEPPEVAAPAVERERGPDGKFVSKDKSAEAAPSATAPAEQKLPATEDVTKASAPQASTPASAPPVSWSADAKASWASLPPAIQKAVLKREEEASNGFRQYSEKTAHYERALAPLAQESARRGMDVSQGIQRLMDGQRFLEQQPEQAILWLAQRNGIDLANLASNPPAVQQPARVDPAFAQVSQTVQSLQDRLDAMMQGQNMTLVQQFAGANPHYADVEEMLPRFISEVQAINPGIAPMEALQQAYDRAIWLNPDVRAKLIAEQTQAETQQRVVKIAEKSQQATRAAVSLKSGTSPTPAPVKDDSDDKDVYDTVRRTLKQLKTA